MTISLNQLTETPIPEQKPVDWDNIRDQDLVECHEDLVPASLMPNRILVRPQYFIQKLRSALSECYVRQGVLNRLVEAVKMLPDNNKLVLFDSWRSLELQQELFDRFRTELAAVHPNLSYDQLTKKAMCFVALPVANSENVSPHITGGSVDLSIADSNGNLLDMGTGFDDTTTRSYTRFYEELTEQKIQITEKEQKILNNRRLLYNTMTSVGFSNYPNEWWHYDFGNKIWAWSKSNGSVARYGQASIKFRWA